MPDASELRREERLVALFNALHEWRRSYMPFASVLAGNWITPQSRALIDAYDEFSKSGPPEASDA